MSVFVGIFDHGVHKCVRGEYRYDGARDWGWLDWGESPQIRRKGWADYRAGVE